MTYPESLDYLFNRLPMYQRVGKAAYKADLNNTIELCRLLGNPENQFKSIHIAGTNGKGSTSHFCAAILKHAGYKTGLYTSPHFKDFRERVRINGALISEQDVVDFVMKHQIMFEKLELSFFEWTVGLAFHQFAKEKVDIAVLETGMGGRLDSTNVVTPLISIITNIGLDHTQFLGNTVEKIAEEKAGIIKKYIPVIIGERQNSKITNVFKNKTEYMETSMVFASDEELNSEFEAFHPHYQNKNLNTALHTIRMLTQTGFSVTKKHIELGIEEVKHHLQGHWQVLQKSPLTICDSGHNASGIQAILEQLASMKYKQLHWVFGMVNDKNHNTILELLPRKAIYYFCQPKIARGMDVLQLEERAQQHGLIGKSYPNVQVALRSAQDASSLDDMVLVAGSTFVVSEVL